MNTTKLIDGVDFGPVWVASGGLNFFGEGWPQHDLLKRIFPDSFDYSGSTFVAKTTTAFMRAGNMALRRNLMPVKFWPDCIHVSPRSFLMGGMLNAVGLSGPGVESLLTNMKEGWFTQKKPFMISFMPVGGDAAERMSEVRHFMSMLRKHVKTLAAFGVPVALQLNLSCPNTGHAIEEFMAEVHLWLDKLATFGWPIILKFSVTTSPRTAMEMCKHPACKGVCISNTVPWGQLPYDEKTNLGIPWERIFGSKKSPLAKYPGGGGYSGKHLLPLVINWILRFNNCLSEDFELRSRIHINGGGGILHPVDVERMIDAGAHSVSIGAVSILRPWNLQPIIYQAHLSVYGEARYQSSWASMRGFDEEFGESVFGGQKSEEL